MASKNKKRPKKRKIRVDRILACAVLLGVIVTAVSCGTSKIIHNTSEVTESTAKKSKGEETTQPQTEAATQDPKKTVNVVATGDNLVQTMVYKTAQAHAQNGEEYNFDFCYENVKDLITSGDLNIMNQETPICNDEFEISGSHFNFNSPTALGDQLINMGVNTFSVCNNHILDKGTDGLRAQNEYWDKKMQENPDIMVYGTYKSQDDVNNIRVKEVNGAKVAFLAYTENTNGYSIDESSGLKVIYTEEKDLIKSQIEKAKQVADIVIVSAHWGDEDTFTTRQGVKDEAQEFINYGADVIIGTHPHTAQGMEYLTRSDGSQGFVFYSLGNFISAQTDNFNLVGEVADFDLVFDSSTKAVTVENVKVVPVITQYDDGSLSNIRVIPYYRYTPELAASHGIPYTTSGNYREWGMVVINKFIDDNIPKQFQCLQDPLSGGDTQESQTENSEKLSEDLSEASEDESKFQQ